MNADLVSALRQRGVDTVTVSDAGLRGATDEDQLLWASRSGRAIYTFNAKDFCRLHKGFIQSGRTHTGIIVGAQ